jgi:hypothetical protein
MTLDDHTNDMPDRYLRKWSRLDNSVLDSDVTRCTHRDHGTPFWAVDKLNAIDSLVNASLIYGAELKVPCCTLAGLSLHSLILHIYIPSLVHSYTINSVLHSPSISHT